MDRTERNLSGGLRVAVSSEEVRAAFIKEMRPKLLENPLVRSEH
jgi:hypothetical protein